VEEGGAYTSLLKRGATNDSDARLVTRLVTGTTVWRLNLDAVIAGLDPSLRKLDDTVRNVLRVALFELLHSGAAPHAAVDAAVTATRALGKASAAGLVNALLRKALRQREAGTLQVPVALASDGAPHLSVAYSMPEWLVSRWMQAFGREGTEQLLIASNRDTPAYGVRACGDSGTDAHTLVDALSAMGLAATASTLLPRHFARVEGTLAPLMPHLQSGRYAIQDEAAGLVVMLLAHDIVPGRETTLHMADVCAAPGGKALFSAALGAHVTAIEVNPGRARLLREAAEAQGVAGRVDVQVADARSWALEHVDCHQAFHIVLVDAPCTGTGVMAKRADMRWRRTVEDISAAAVLQLELLAATCVLVAPGGCLVYSTCSLEAEENQGVVTAFLASPQGARFQLQPASEVAGIPREALSPDRRFLAPLPHVCGTDGAFGARLVRNPL
jgi:16S rRNA (cytosine967-C5)-methyltransferase